MQKDMNEKEQLFYQAITAFASCEGMGAVLRVKKPPMIHLQQKIPEVPD
jgi:hypothetical protein